MPKPPILGKPRALSGTVGREVRASRAPDFGPATCHPSTSCRERAPRAYPTPRRLGDLLHKPQHRRADTQAESRAGAVRKARTSTRSWPSTLQAAHMRSIPWRARSFAESAPTTVNVGLSGQNVGRIRPTSPNLARNRPNLGASGSARHVAACRLELVAGCMQRLSEPVCHRDGQVSAPTNKSARCRKQTRAQRRVTRGGG